MKPYDFYYDHPVREWPFISRGVYTVIGIVAYGVSKLLFRWKVEGAQDYLAAQKQAYRHAKKGTILICNHVSVVEPPILVSFAWAHHFRLRPLYKIELEKNRLIRWLFSRMGGIPVHRGEEDLKLIKRSAKLLHESDSLLIFPEGTRVHLDKEPVPFHKGFAVIAKIAKTPVYTAAVTGAGQILPTGKKLPRPHKVHVLFGRALTLDSCSNHKNSSAIEALTKAGEDSVFLLRETLRKQYPGCQ